MHSQPVRRRILLSLWLLGCLAAFPSHAQTVYAPTSAWLVGPVTQVPDVKNKVPCVAVNHFNNGYIFRLSGGGGQLMAMAIDFRQKAFKLDQKYEVEFSVPGQYFQTITATPYDHGTLLFNLYKFPDFYKALQNAETLVIKAGGQELTFMLTGLKDGFGRMESCYAPGNAASAAPAMPPQNSPVQGMGKAGVSTTPPKTPAQPPQQAEAARANPLIAQSREGGALTPMPGEEIPAVPETTPPPVMPAPPVAMTPVDQMASAASLAEKANIAQSVADQLTRRNPAKKEAYAGASMASSWTETDTVRKSRDIISNAPARGQGEVPASQIMRWRALKGSSLRNVLDLWTKSTNRMLVWNGDDFPVTRSMAIEGTFETAVQGLLEIYADDPARPVGRMYVDPKSAQSVLVIETLKTQH